MAPAAAARAVARFRAHQSGWRLSHELSDGMLATGAAGNGQPGPSRASLARCWSQFPEAPVS